MVPVAFAESNKVLSPPPGLEEDCEALSVFSGTLGGDPCLIACFKLTEAEFEEVNRTKRVWVGIRGSTLPPVFLTGCSPFEGPVEWPPNPNPPIKAEAHSDDRVYEVSFEASRWFSEAADHEILVLAENRWGGCPRADGVATYMAKFCPELADMFRYLERIANVPSKKDESGFECNIDEASAIAWIRAHRPELIPLIQKDDDQTGEL